MHSPDLRGMFGALERLGYDIDLLLEPFGLNRADLDDPDGCLPSQVCAEIFAAIQGERRVKNLALCIAVETPIGAYPLLDYLFCSSESVGEGLKQIARYLSLVNPAVRLVFREEEEPHPSFGGRLNRSVHGRTDGISERVALDSRVWRSAAGGADLLSP
jgi:hypothetical protein